MNRKQFIKYCALFFGVSGLSTCKNTFALSPQQQSGQGSSEIANLPSKGKLKFANWHNGQTVVPQFETTYTLNWGGCSNVNVDPNAVRAAGRKGGDVFALTGDFIYIDGRGPQNYERYSTAFNKAMNRPDWQSVIRKHTAVIGVQDDHDYGADAYAGADDGAIPWARDAYREIMPQPSDKTYFSWTTGGVKFFMLDSRLYAHHPKQQSTLSFPAFLGQAQWDWFRQEYETNLQKLNVVILPLSPAFASTDGGGAQVRFSARQMLRDFLDQHDANCVLLTSDRHACGHANYTQANSSAQIHEFLAGPMGTKVRHQISSPDDIDVVWSNASTTRQAPADYSAFGSLSLDRANRSATVKIIKHDNSEVYSYTLPNIL